MTTARRRDAASTRRLLLSAARRGFARNGYAATTVRDIADEAGVNVALINRYFTSKEGLFEACLRGVGDELGDTGAGRAQVPRTIARQLSGQHAHEHPNQLLLLLRSSGDVRAEQIRLGILRSFAERLAAQDDQLIAVTTSGGTVGVGVSVRSAPTPAATTQPTPRAASGPGT